MPLEVATYINQLNTANPVGSDPLAQADDHLRLLKTTIKNTFPNIDGAVTVTDDVLNALPGRVTTLEASGGGGGTTTTQVGVETVSSLPTTNNYVGRVVYLTTDKRLYSWNGSSWAALTQPNVTPITPDTPNSIKIVSSLPTTATDGDVVFNTTDNKLYERVNGVWVEVVITVNAAQEVADASITVAKFAQGIRPIEIVSTLPTTGNSEGRLVYLTTDDKIYRFNGAAFTASMPFGDLTGTIAANQIAANTITGGKIVAGAIGADQIASNAIQADKIAAGVITTEKIAAIAVTADKIATNAITSDKISANAITAGKIAAAAIGTTQLSASAVTSDKISSGSITSDLISVSAVGTLQIGGNAVTVPVVVSSGVDTTLDSSYQTLLSTSIFMSTSGVVFVGLTANQAYMDGNQATRHRILINGAEVTVVGTGVALTPALSLSGGANVSAGTVTVQYQARTETGGGSGTNTILGKPVMFVQGAKR